MSTMFNYGSDRAESPNATGSNSSLPMYTDGGLPGYRRNGEIATEISKGQDVPTMPRELFGIVSPDVWVERCAALQKVHERFFANWVEKAAWIVAFVAVIVLPWPLMSLVDRTMARRTEAEFWEIKMIGLGIFFGIFVVFFGPLVGWRCLANYRLKQLLAKFKTQDAHRSFPASMQVWSTRSASYSIRSWVLTIIVTVPPPPGAVSNFHPEAYLPAYIPKQNSRPNSPSNDAPELAEVTLASLPPPSSTAAAAIRR